MEVKISIKIIHTHLIKSIKVVLIQKYKEDNKFYHIHSWSNKPRPSQIIYRLIKIRTTIQIQSNKISCQY